MWRRIPVTRRRTAALVALPTSTLRLTPAPDVAALASAAPAATLALAAGTRLFEYRIEGVIGRGGFGVAYSAVDVNLNADVVIKEYLPGDIAYRSVDLHVRPRSPDYSRLYALGREQFLVEARALATCRHPNIVRVIRFFEANDSAYMVLEHEHGKSLDEWRREQDFITEARIVEPFASLLDGLAVVHAAGYLHCDIKPENICVRDDDGSFVLLDFGAARQSASEAGDLPEVLTPGYGAIELHSGVGRQGPWTDIYALGATLYWLVGGMKPPDAALRLEDPAIAPTAEYLGAGRYSQGFLRAIDWALAVLPADRPQSVDEFRRVLFSAHATVLSIREALADDDDAERTSWFAALRSWPLFKKRLLGFVATLARPRAWPFVAKLTVAMVLATLVPMMITAAYNVSNTRDHFVAVEKRNLTRIAQGSAARIAQLLNDSRNLADYIWRDDDFAQFLQRPTDASSNAVFTKLRSLVEANDDIQFAMLMNAQGMAVISTDPQTANKSYAFRDYFKQAMAGEPYMTGVIVGSVAGEPGIFYSRPVRSRTVGIVGVLVIRIRGSAVARILIDASPDELRVPFLIDHDGVIVWHPQLMLQFKSLVALSPQALEAVRADRRFRRDSIESLDERELAPAMIGARRPGNIEHASAMLHRPAITGFAPVPGYDWVVGVTESQHDLVAPIYRLYLYVLGSVVVVGIIFFVIVVVLARAFVRPLNAITAATNALKRGDYAHAAIPVTSADEVGRLARAFNVMLDVVRQRERERERKRPPSPPTA